MEDSTKGGCTARSATAGGAANEAERAAGGVTVSIEARKEVTAGPVSIFGCGEETISLGGGTCKEKLAKEALGWIASINPNDRLAWAADAEVGGTVELIQLCGCATPEAVGW